MSLFFPQLVSVATFMQPGIVLKALVNMSVGKNSNRQTATVVVLDTTITPIANLATVILMVLLILIVKQKASNILVSITMLESSVTSAGKDFTIFLNVFVSNRSNLIIILFWIFHPHGFHFCSINHFRLKPYNQSRMLSLFLLFC